MEEINIPLKIDGKSYDLNGKQVKLYPISKLSQALTDAGITRDVQTIRKWEQLKVIPPTIFRSGGKRLYSQEQIDAIVRVAVECNIQQGVSLEASGFVDKVWSELDRIHKSFMAVE